MATRAGRWCVGRVVVGAVLWVAGALGPPRPAVASDQCPNGGNEAANCGFEVNTTGWTKVMGDSLTRSSTRAHTGGFSGLVNAENFSSSFFAELTTCVQNVAPSTGYLFGGWLYLVTTSTSVDCTITAEELGASGTACGGTHIETSDTPLFPSTGAWEEILSKFFTGATTEDVRFSIECRDVIELLDFQVWFDDLHLIPFDTIFLDDFETQNTCVWTLAVGGGCA